MSSEVPQITEVEAQLTLRDRINHNYLLANAILTFQKILPNIYLGEREVRESILGLKALIPSSWKDDEWYDDLTNAVVIEKIDIRPEFCGIKPPIEVCQDLGIPFEKEDKTFNYMKLFEACVNLMDRRGLISRKAMVEMMTGKKGKKGIPKVNETDVEEI